MTPIFRTLVCLMVVVLMLIELLYAQSQPHWFVVVLGFAILNSAAFVGVRLGRLPSFILKNGTKP